MSYLGVHLFLALLNMVLQNGRDAGLCIQTRFSVSCECTSRMFPSWDLEIEQIYTRIYCEKAQL